MFVHLSTFWFPDSNSKMIPLIDLKFNRMVGHYLFKVAIEIGVSQSMRLLFDFWTVTQTSVEDGKPETYLPTERQ